MADPTPQDLWVQSPHIGVDPKNFDAPGGSVPISEVQFNITVPVVKKDLGYITGQGSVGYAVTYKPAEESDSPAALKFKNGKPECEAALKQKFGKAATLSGGGTLSATEGSVGVGLEVQESADKPKTSISFKVVKVDATKAEFEFAVLEWEQTYPLAGGTFTAAGLNIRYDGSIVVKVEFSPNKEKIATEFAKRLATKGGQDAAADAAADSTASVSTGEALGFALDAGLVLVAIGTVAGTFNELSKAADARQLGAQIDFCRNSYTTGLEKALRGEPNPGGPWPSAGWNVGKQIFDGAVEKARKLHPDWDDEDLRDRVAQGANRLAQDGAVQKAIKTNVGQGFWNRWIEANHGLGTFLGDAKDACARCFGEALINENDPRLDAWKKVSSLPDLLK